MNVAVLRNHLRDLSGFLEAAGAARRVTDELRLVADKLAVFDAHTLADFLTFLQKAEEFDRTGVLPVTGKAKAPPKPKAPSVNAEQVREQVVLVYERAATATDEEIATSLAPLAKLKKADLEPIAAAVGLATKGRSTIKSLLADIERLIRDRRGIAQRNEY